MPPALPVNAVFNSTVRVVDRLPKSGQRIPSSLSSPHSVLWVDEGLPGEWRPSRRLC